MIGEKADVEYCTVDFIKQDLVSPVYKTLAYVAGIQKGRECVRSAKNGQGVSSSPFFLAHVHPNSLSPPVWTLVMQANKLFIYCFVLFNRPDFARV